MIANGDDTRASAVVRTPPVEPAIGDELSRLAAAAAAKHTSENFPVALRVLPRTARDALLRIYAFARFVDDIGDAARGDRLGMLDAVDADIARLPHAGAVNAPVAALADLLASGTISPQPLHNLVEANRRDQLIASYESFDDLLGYCSLSAAPIGRLVLQVAGVIDPVAIGRSDRVCAALQVLEHCQDVREDALAGRVYLPARELREAGVHTAALAANVTPAPLRRVVEVQVTRAEALLRDGTPLVGQLHGWARVAVLGYVGGGRATAIALRRAHYDVLPRTVRPSRRTAVGQALLVAGGARR